MTSQTNRRAALRTVLALTGLAMVVLGLNVAFGGIKTLGLQGATEFLVVTDAQTFAVRDNHVRFLGGFWLSAGCAFIAGAISFAKMQSSLKTLCFMVAIAGLSRLSGEDSSLIMSADILPSFTLELFGFPLLAVWINRQRN